MEKIRLDKYISSQLNISRSDAKALIRKKLVSVNGGENISADASINVLCDEVYCRGQRLCYKKNIYIMLNKPKGIVSASSSIGDITVIDILPESLKRQGLFPAGRLDKDTTGFVLITDDGEFAHSILSPSRHVPKTYELTAARTVTESEYNDFISGIDLGDIILKPAKLWSCGYDSTLNNLPKYRITITEGRYHQIKRMFAKSGNKVLALHRLSIGDVELDSKLKEGECRELTENELKKIIISRM